MSASAAKKVGNNQESKVNLKRIIKHSQESSEKLGAVRDILEYECGHCTLLPIVKKLMILDYLIMHYTDGGCDLEFGIALAVSRIVGDCAQELQRIIQTAGKGDLESALY